MTITQVSSHVADIVAMYAQGNFIIVSDDEDRENEGDLMIAAEFADAKAINFMITQGKGLVCMAISNELARKNNLTQMVTQNRCPHGTAFTVSVDAPPGNGVTTGISAFDRAATIKLLLDGTNGGANLISPGHMFPLVARDGGVLERAGHTECAVDLSILAGLKPAGVIVEIIGEDGDMLRGADLDRFAARFNIARTTISRVQEFIRARGRSVVDPHSRAQSVPA